MFINGIIVTGNIFIICVRVWMFVLMLLLVIWEIMKLIVDVVLLCMLSKCGEIVRILESRVRGKI